MKILKFRAENFKRLSVVEIAPNGQVVEITGKNGSGKTSVLDAIWTVMGGGDHIPAQPIRAGEKKAKIMVALGGEKVELVAERRFTESGSTLVVETADGARRQSPQTILNGLIGALSFDPLEFSRLKPPQQVETLKRLVKVDFDFEQADGQNEHDFEARTEANRDAKALRAQADGITVPEGLPDQPINTQELLDELTAVGDHNSAIAKQETERAEAIAAIRNRREAAGQKRQRAAELREQAAALDAEAKAAEETCDSTEQTVAALGPLPERKDASEIRGRIEKAQTINHGIEIRQRRTRLNVQAETYEAESKRLTEAMDARTAAKHKAITEAKMPIDGLGLGSSSVTYNGLPLDQASSAEQIRISMAIAMAMNPKLRVICIREGSLLDDDGLTVIADMAKAGDFQVWLEKVDTTGNVGIVLEDGHVKGVAAPSVEPGKLL